MSLLGLNQIEDRVSSAMVSSGDTLSGHEIEKTLGVVEGISEHSFPAVGIGGVGINGTIDTIDRATGREVSPCVIAVQAAKSDLMGMNFSLVETAACLNRLGGKISENLAELSSIVPITE